MHGWRKQFRFAVACNNFCKTGLSQIKLSHVEAVAENVLQPSNRFQARHRAPPLQFTRHGFGNFGIVFTEFFGTRTIKNKTIRPFKSDLSTQIRPFHTKINGTHTRSRARKSENMHNDSITFIYLVSQKVYLKIKIRNLVDLLWSMFAFIVPWCKSGVRTHYLLGVGS